MWICWATSSNKKYAANSGVFLRPFSQRLSRRELPTKNCNVFLNTYALFVHILGRVSKSCVAFFAFCEVQKKNFLRLQSALRGRLQIIRRYLLFKVGTFFVHSVVNIRFHAAKSASIKSQFTDVDTRPAGKSHSLQRYGDVAFFVILKVLAGAFVANCSRQNKQTALSTSGWACAAGDVFY
ncbi:MAG TPA: hypothetical protein IAC72_02240 [Candidatus Fimimonas merdipullorum]|uniref:Uncharacterized protein n=1 Tax=Candidatus Fimimonas merdipullorum TaxID=2840822 RepID=A0A9D1SPP3_9BACT|nr:hypothetical protein [Candidatus Fimimonas merdipullorum]